MWLSALERVVEDAGFEAIARLRSPEEAVEALRQDRPDLFVLDIDVDGTTLDGLNCLRRVREVAPSTKTLVVSSSDDTARIEAALGAGAMAYVLKRAEPGDLSSAIRQLFERSLYLAGTTHSPAPAPSAEAENVNLTRREREILQLVAEGMTNGNVARKLWVTEQTVKFHLANIFRKLDVTNRTQASRWAHSHGLLAEAHDAESVEAASVA